MTDVLLGILILAVGGLGVAVVVSMKRRGQGDAAAEQRLLAEKANLEGQLGELRGRLSNLVADNEDLGRRLEAEHTVRVQAETRLDAERTSFDEQRQLLDEAEVKLKDAFAALSAEALKTSRTDFLSQADQRLKPIQDLMATYEGHLREIEKARNDAYGGLKNHLDSLAKAHDLLQREAHQLSTALRSPTVRGRWGEMTLRRVVEVAGMSPHCDFEEQVTVQGADGALRPDMTIKLSADRMIVVDSKVPLAGYMDAIEAKDEAARQAAFARHAQDVRKHVQALSRKAYWDQFESAPDFVVLFLPGESFFSVAMEQDHGLMEDAMRSKVFLATPTTLMALLNIVALGWRQQEMAEGAAKIAEAGKQLYDRICTFASHLAGVGDGLDKAHRSYDKAVGSYERMLVPGAKKLADLGASSGKDVPELPSGAGPARSLAAPGFGAPEEPPADA